MPRVKKMPARRSKFTKPNFAAGRRVAGPGLRRVIPRGIVTNTAAVRENYTVSLTDGAMTFINIRLNQPGFNRSQAIAELFQEYRVKYIRLMLRPAADTWPVGAGPIPQLYFQLNKYASIANTATLANLLDMGCRPIRFDDKNIHRIWKPVVLLGANNSSGTTVATTASVKVSPWLSTNGFAGDPDAWTLSDIEHYGAAFIVTKPSPTTPTIAYNMDVEVVFQFRRPLSNQGPGSTSYQVVNGEEVTIVDVSGGVPPAASLSGV